MEMLKKDIRYPIMIQAINDARDRRVFQRAEGKYDQIAQSSESTSNALFRIGNKKIKQPSYHTSVKTRKKWSEYQICPHRKICKQSKYYPHKSKPKIMKIQLGNMSLAISPDTEISLSLINPMI